LAVTQAIRKKTGGLVEVWSETVLRTLEIDDGVTSA
jgi:hypothetical protein